MTYQNEDYELYIAENDEYLPMDHGGQDDSEMDLTELFGGGEQWKQDRL